MLCMKTTTSFCTVPLNDRWTIRERAAFSVQTNAFSGSAKQHMYLRNEHRTVVRPDNGHWGWAVGIGYAHCDWTI